MNDPQSPSPVTASIGELALRTPQQVANAFVAARNGQDDTASAQYLNKLMNQNERVSLISWLDLTIVN